jgi:hypothetical protein
MKGLTMTRILLLAALLATPSFAGGPVIVTEEPPIADVRPQGDGGKWVVPVIVGIIAIGIIASGDGSDCTCQGPEDGGNGCGC